MNINSLGSPKGITFNFNNDEIIKAFVESTNRHQRIPAFNNDDHLPDDEVILIDDSNLPRREVQLNMDSFVERKRNPKKRRDKREISPVPVRLPATDGFVMASGSTQIVRELRPVVARTAVINPTKRRTLEDIQDSPSDKEPPLTEEEIKLRKNVNPEMFEAVSECMINITGISMEDILGNESAKRALEESVILPNLNPAIFTGLREPVKGILLFGPPGNGKTMLAKAVATESRCRFFNVSAATIMSKWVGEGERLMQALFQVARNAQPSIIFIDEIDSLLCSRQENENGASRRVKTEFLLQFDGCVSKVEDRILVLGATNRPQELDDGVLRRFPRRIYIDLPDQKARAELIKIIFHKNHTTHNLKDEEIDEIAGLSDNYSYSDMTALCKDAAMAPLRNLTRQQLEVATAENIRPVNYEDMKDSVSVVRASSNLENTKKLLEFARNFAQFKM